MMNNKSIASGHANAELRNVVVSIVMPVYNASATVSAAIKSIIAQRFVHWELLALDDGSIDNTKEVILGFKDLRIRLVFFENNFVATLKHGFSEAKGKCIARMGC